MSQEQTHALYRFFDAGGDLLYVGITNDPGRRWGRHANDKPWWHEVDHIEIERYPDRESVLAAEQKATKEERPKYNVVHKPVELSPTIVEDRPAPGVCACGATAEVLYVLYRDIAEHETEMTAWNRKQSDR
jgi:predicted GIY-YIG superfamily endonuclease